MEKITPEETKALVERLEKANADSKLILERAEKLKAQEILGGTTNAGSVPVQISDAEKIKAGAKDFFKGTVLDGMIK